VIYSSREYRNGSYTEEINRALQGAEGIRSILERVSGRSLPQEWSPFYPICSICGTISSARILEHDEAHHRVRYRCGCGNEGWADYSRGEGKLVWRVDWPMRWAHFGITVEPFGKDHASAGGSYDTGKEIAAEIYRARPPFPVVYEWISLKGRGEMHSSKGVAITINEMLDIVPPEVLRYLIVRTRPEKTIDFDPGMGLISLIDEFDRVAAAAEGREYELSRISSIPTRIPFRHMVTVVQIAHDERGIFQCLARSGYNVADYENILHQAERVKRWLRRYAPESVKFSVKEELPATGADLAPGPRAAIREYIRILENLTHWSAEELHNAVYEVAEQQNVPAKDIFMAIYLAFLGQKRGPRLGWFLEALGKEKVLIRLHKVVGSGIS
jgi:lysyl-tRNA synthetase class 1